MIFIFRNKIPALRNKTSLLLVYILFSLFFNPSLSVSAGYPKTDTDSEIKNPKIFKLCENLDLFVSEVVASDNEIIILKSDKKIIGIDSISFLKIWDYEIPGELISEPKLENNRLFLETIETEREKVTKDNDNVSKNDPIEIAVTTINANTGIPTEVKKFNETGNYLNQNPKINYKNNPNTTKPESIDSLVTISKENGNNLISGYRNGEITLLNESTKLTVWKTKVGGEITSITILDKGFIISSKDNFLYFLDFKNGNKIWKKRMSGRVIKVLIIDDNLAGIVDSNNIYLINIDSGMNFGTLIRENESEILEIKKYSKNDLILLSTSGVSLYSDSKCKN